MSPNIDGVDVERGALSAESERQFDEWVQHRLSSWSTAQIRELDIWLLDEGHHEFVAAVRRAWTMR